MNKTTQRTYDRIFEHPITHNLDWGDVRSMFEDLGEVEQEHNGNLKVNLSGHAVVFHSPNTNDVATADEVTRIRHFIRSSEEGNADHLGEHILISIDHQGAKIFRTEVKGEVPELIVPYDPEGHKSHVHSPHSYPGHGEKPNYDAYFVDIAGCLTNAKKILIFGSGEGSSSAMDTFVAWLKEHHPHYAERIIGAVKVDQSHLTEPQLLAKAREIYRQEV